MRAAKVAFTTSLLALCLVLLFAGSAAYAQTPASISVSSSAGVVGSKLTISGAGYPASTMLTLEWNSANANWVVGSIPGSAGESPPQVTGINAVPFEKVLGTALTDASGSFSVQIVTPSDFGMQHIIQAYAPNGTALAPKATYTTEPSFTVSPLSGPAGTPVTITGTGLGDGLYSTNYHVYWDNNYVGYATAIDSQGSTSFTIYASGVPGTHFLAIYQGYPGPGYLNAEQIPVASQSQSYFPPGCTVMVSCTIPYYVNFTVTSSGTPTSLAPSGLSLLGSLAFVPILGATAALLGGALFVSRQDSRGRKAITRSMAAFGVVLLLVIAGVALYANAASGASAASTITSTVTSTSTASAAAVTSTVVSTVTSTVTYSPTTSTITSAASSSSTPISFTPVASVDRPQVTIPVYNTATTGPRITATPEIVSVGQTINVTGMGFTPNTQLPITWSTRQGSNLLGYKLVALPLRNVTTDSNGDFTFMQKVHSDVGGIHFVAAGSLTPNSNATVFLQRSGTISATQGPAGTRIVISMVGVGWDYNTNIVAVDYDNSYVGYGCGFNTGGNATITIFAAGAPGVHTIDVYPSIWWGESGPTAQQDTIYRYPLLTPQDHPELMPSFHFTFLLTGSTG